MTTKRPYFLQKLWRMMSPRYKTIDPYTSFLMEFVSSQSGKHFIILDIGGSNGIFISKMARDRKNIYINVDLDLLALKQCKNAARNVECVCADATSLPLKERSIDIVYSISLFEHMFYVEKAINEQCRVSKKIVVFQIPELKYFIEIHTLVLILGWMPRIIKEKISKKREPLGLNWQCSVKQLIKIFQRDAYSLLKIQRIYHAKPLKLLMLPMGYIVALVRTPSCSL